MIGTSETIIIVGILFLVVLLLFLLAIPIWAVIDAASRPSSQWKAAQLDRTTWVILVAGGTVFLAPVGFCFAIYYLLLIRPKLDAGSW
jgi:uncharacterized BrkB/YihY/UPF0761 family membrane protein